MRIKYWSETGTGKKKSMNDIQFTSQCVVDSSHEWLASAAKNLAKSQAE